MATSKIPSNNWKYLAEIAGGTRTISIVSVEFEELAITVGGGVVFVPKALIPSSGNIYLYTIHTLSGATVKPATLKINSNEVYLEYAADATSTAKMTVYYR